MSRSIAVMLRETALAGCLQALNVESLKLGGFSAAAVAAALAAMVYGAAGASPEMFCRILDCRVRDIMEYIRDDDD